MTTNVDLNTLSATIAAANAAAAQAAVDYIAKHGEPFYCGFAWVSLPEVKLNTKVGKALAAEGFRKAYGKGVDLWNPSRNGTQSMEVKEHAAHAFVKVLNAAYPDLKAYVGTRAD